MLTILLVDDERLVRRSLEKTLVRAGFDVLTAEDCPSGLETFRQAAAEGSPIQLAVLDLNMPNFEGQPAPGAGLDLLSKLREQDPHLKVIVLTAYDEINKAKDAVQRGASAYFVKGREKGLVELIHELTAQEA
ncbi:MAG: response regulator [Anaerolineae bacterium]|nr:MAG: response regulator [Anaerolineae bacterium]